MYSAVASSFFAVRNAKKTENGEVGRSAVALGQVAGVIQEIAKYDGAIASTAKSACSIFSNMQKQNKAFEYAGKFTKFAVNNVNPLICVSGGIKTLTSDDKVGTGITEAAALSAMFLGEGLTKKHYDKMITSKTCQNLLQKAKDTRILKPVFEYIKMNKLGGKIGLVLKGVTFVIASMSSYAIGEYFGKDIAKDVKKELGLGKPKKINQKA